MDIRQRGGIAKNIIFCVSLILLCSTILSGCGVPGPIPKEVQSENSQETDSQDNSAQETSPSAEAQVEGSQEIEPESVKLNKGKCSIIAGKTVKLKATIYPNNATDTYTEWMSDDDDIAIVNSEGLVTGKKAGITNIIVRTSNGKEASCTVSVKKKKSQKSSSSHSEDREVIPDDYPEIDSEEDGSHTPFYGIWCGAAKTHEQAEKEADKLRGKGLGAEVFVTTDWSNLNKEKWYVVTAGVYSSKSSANASLPSVRAVYPEAYVKYTGEWTG